MTRLLRHLTCLCGLLVAVLAGAPAAYAHGPAWTITSVSEPTNLAPGATPTVEDYGYVLTAINTGATAAVGSEADPIVITDTLPEGLTATRLQAHDPTRATGENELSCNGSQTVRCFYTHPVPPGGLLYVLIRVNVAEHAPASVVNSASVTGGGAAEASTSEPTTISSTPAPFGIQSFVVASSSTRAGGHPNVTTSFQMNSVAPGNNTLPQRAGALKEVEINVPPGLVGDAAALPRCAPLEVAAGTCPADTRVGIAIIDQFVSFVNNVAPYPGEPAAFMFSPSGDLVRLDTSVRSGGDYGIRISAHGINEAVPILESTVTLWGSPAAYDGPDGPREDPTRESDETGGGACPQEHVAEGGSPAECGEFGGPGGGVAGAFLSNPTRCGEQLPYEMTARPWSPEDGSNEKMASTPALSGCDVLPFEPAFSAVPDTTVADTPAGFTFDLRVPQEGLTTPEGFTSADLKDTTVTLPAGLAINPGQAAGLQACPFSQDGVGGEGPPSCPAASKVGSVQITSPLLPDKLEGTVYILPPNPPNLRLLVAASADGVNVKLIGNVHLNEATGQLTATFDEAGPGVAGTPQLPFTDFKLSFSGGAQAALTTPTLCGGYSTSADFTPWSNPFAPDALGTDRFSVSSGPGGGSCSSPLPFGPSMIAGATTDQAGGFTNFSLLLQKGDGQERVEKLQFKAPSGLAGMISSVPLCPEPQASQGTCPASSHIGHAVVAAGPGPYPLVLPQLGDPELPIYLTGPYKGAPFGLSIVTPVVAGPFNLGTVITRAKIEIDPRTAQITVTTDPLPQVVDGVPADLRQIDSVIDRPGFIFNPTNCNSQEFSGAAWGTPPPGAGGPGATAPLSSHFGVGSCRSLEFHPTIGVSTAAKSSKANGASLNFKIAYPKGAMGSESWFNEAKFDLPKQLPARLTTLQKACLAATFEANPASCPPHSLIGRAIVHTPVLPVPLEGPVYFVSYGNAKFPEAVIVLKGDGVTIDLHGETFINGKTEVTSATFRNTPDVPFESIEVTLPSGPFSEFGAFLPAKAKGSFCGQKLVMPTLFKAQNGLEIHQTTPVHVTGCPKHRKALGAKRRRHRRKG